VAINLRTRLQSAAFWLSSNAGVGTVPGEAHSMEMVLGLPFGEARLKPERDRVKAQCPNLALELLDRRDPASGTARVRLLDRVRRVLLATPEAFGDISSADHQLRVIRGRVAVTIGIAIALLQQVGCKQMERLYNMRDVLGDGGAISADDLMWLDHLIDQQAPIVARITSPGWNGNRPTAA
jgi:hypothetical protein